MSAFVYKFAEGAVHRVSAQDTGEIIERLQKEYGACTPTKLVEVSKSPDAPLHDEFEWDDSVAASKWRIEQARLLISHVRIVHSDSEAERGEYTRAFVSAPGRNSAYVSIDTALNKEEFRKHLIEQARRESECFIAKYRSILELSGAIAELEKFVKSV